MASFVYSPLAAGSIRLISALCIISSPPADDQIKCTLNAVELDTNPTYDCLSYTWEEPLYQKYLLVPRVYEKNRTYPIDCNGQVFRIAENLRDALVQIGKSRASGQGGGFRRLQDQIWVDAMCIDQGNEEEKRIQIRMMSRIYAHAQSVVVWLGPEMPDDPGLKKSLLIMERLSQIPPEKFKTAVLSRLGNTDTYQNLGIQYIATNEWVCFGSFILRRWFSRMWVVQEAFFAKKFIVFCGPNILPWSQITSASRVLKETSLGALLNEVMEDRDRTTLGELRTTSQYVLNPIANQFRFHDYKNQPSPLTLERLLADSRYFGAAQAEDHVFAVLNMWKPSSRKRKRGSDAEDESAIFIMKNSTPVEVYERASIVAIREAKNLNLLSLVEDKNWRCLRGLPSWVPDFSAPLVWTPLAGAPPPPLGTNRWNATKGLEFALPPLETDSGRLIVKGVRVDDIESRAETDLNLIDECQMVTLLDVLSRYLDFESSNPSVTSIEDRFESFWKTLIKDSFLGREAGLEARKAIPMIFVHFVREMNYEIDSLRTALKNPAVDQTKSSAQHTRLRALSETCARTRAHVERLAALHNSVIPSWEFIQRAIRLKDTSGMYTADSDTDLVNIMESFNAAYQCRRLFRTRRNYLGIAAQSLKDGDVVWVLAGMAVPVVLRHKDEKRGSWEFVGEAYVHGIMNGEAAVGQEVSIVLE
jgi:Heterokaryon incompatibility protein (HET)